MSPLGVDASSLDNEVGDMVRTSLRHAVALAVASCVLMTAGCSGDSSDDAGENGNVTLTFSYRGDGTTQAAWNKVFAEFQQEHPNITIKGEPIVADDWSAFFTKISTQVAGGRVPDIAQVATEGQRLFASNGLLEPLNSYIEKDRAVIDDFTADVPPSLQKWTAEYASSGSETYYLPGDFNTVGIWANKDVFSKAGVALPGPDGWTWQQFEQTAQQIKEKTGAYAFDVTSTYAIGVLPWANSNDASAMNEDWSKVTVDTPRFTEAVTFAKGLIDKGYSPVPGGTFDETTMFAQGKLAMFSGGQWTIGGLRNQNLVAKAQLLPWPHNEGAKGGSPVGYNGYPIFAASKHKDAAWEFVKYLTTAKAQSFYASLGSQATPPRRSVATSSAVLANTPVGTDMLYTNLDRGTVIPAPNNGAEFTSAIQDGISQILIGNTSVDAGLKKTQSDLESVISG